ncbi:hypothetical protein COCMIDRAFT_101705, partial [Bipolaris oryzae ATCC 44560]
VSIPLVTLAVATIAGNFAPVPSLLPTHSIVQIAEVECPSGRFIIDTSIRFLLSLTCILFNIALSPR